MVRPRNATGGWQSIVADVALVLCAIALPPWASLSLNGPVGLDGHSGTPTLISDDHGMSVAPATPDRTFHLVDDSAFIEESEQEEQSDPFLDRISPAFNAMDGLHKARAGLPLAIPHLRIVALPLRC
ncbi:hypothetical protein AB1L88_08950 [Tautonia sp. JC769]|uniref:hypothetical protein n=1 Tax=Tautonia sp. JC769 TaxID=3232135 RepID=UPI003458ABB7